MASSDGYLEYVLGLLRDVPSVSYRKMMGEFLLYSEGVLFGGIYDDRFLLKEIPATRAAFSSAEIPYEGAKPMLLVDAEDPEKSPRWLPRCCPRFKVARARRGVNRGVSYGLVACRLQTSPCVSRASRYFFSAVFCRALILGRTQMETRRATHARLPMTRAAVW